MSSSAGQAVGPPDVVSGGRDALRRWVYRPELDGLRALAMLAVVAYHYDSERFGGGYLGVPVFFVLSGYLITGLLTAERESKGRVDLLAFYARRALRLYPALLVVVLGALILAPITGHRGVPTPRLYDAGAASLLYINDFVLAAGAHLTYWFDVTWSLGVEEQFYLVWPLILLFALSRLDAPTVGRCCVALAIVAGVVDIVCQPLLGFAATYYSPIGSAMPLLLGCGISFLPVRLPARSLARLRGLAAAGCLALAALVVLAPPLGDPSVWRGPEQITAIAAAAVIYFLASTSGFAVMRSRVLVWLGRRSYGIYLIHEGVRSAVQNALPHARGSLVAALGVSGSVALAGLCYHYVEAPFLRRKRRFARVATVSAA